jgi:hypothetical protein
MSSSRKSCAPTSIQRACVRVGAVQLRHEAKSLYDSKGQSNTEQDRNIQVRGRPELVYFRRIYAVAHALAALRLTPYALLACG